MKKLPGLHIGFLSLAVLLLAACNVTKKLPENEQLYWGADINIKDDSTNHLKRKEKKILEDLLEPLVRPKPNSRILGIPLKLWVYQHVEGNPKKERGLRNWIRKKFSEPPVLASSLNLQKNVELLNNRMDNLGYFTVQTEGDTTSKNKKVTAHFTVIPGVQYTIRRVEPPADSVIIEANKPFRSRRMRKVGGGKTLLKEGEPYNVDVFVTERQRIAGRLKRRGYYHFSPEHILMRVDSTVGNNQVDVFEVIKPETPPEALQKYYINDIYIYPHYDLSQDTLTTSAKSVRKVDDFYVIDPTNSYKPKLFEKTMFFNKYDLYNERNQQLTLNRLVSLDQFKFVKNKFEEILVGDSSMLDVYYYLTPLKKKALRAEVNAKYNTAGYTGSKIDVSWRHRNIFRGGELFIQKIYTGMDFQISGTNKGYNVFSLGAETNLDWPRIVPFNFRTGSAYIPHTRLTIGYDWQKRLKLYTLNTGRGSYGYYWKSTAEEEHEFNLVNVVYVNSSNVTQEYRDKIALDPSLNRVIEKQFIMGPSYSYTYTNTMRQFKKHTFYYQGTADLSNNIIGLIQGANVKKNNPKELLGVQYSQYLRFEQDLRYYLKTGAASEWASRIYAGIGLPYGNSRQLPFIKQFFSGGAQSLRGFRTRTVGPGAHAPQVDPDGFLPDQTGDIKLEFNSEYRFKLFSIVHGAVFTDVGNVWLKNYDTSKPKGHFTGQFLNQLAVDGGFGIRLDVTILLIRLDIGIPFRKPAEGKWVFDQINFGSKDWRQENIVYNIAIGMPF